VPPWLSGKLTEASDVVSRNLEGRVDRRSRGAPYQPARQERFWDFVEGCGGNFDWIISGDVTSLVIFYAGERPKPRPYCGQVYEVLDDDEALAEGQS
jgi:hypothetical protein